MFVSQVLRGDEAAAEFDKYFFNANKVGEGQEIILVKIQIDTDSDSVGSWNFGLAQFFTGYSGYNDRLKIAPYGLPRNGVGYVWEAYIIDKSEVQPKLAFNPTSVNNVWFRLY